MVILQVWTAVEALLQQRATGTGSADFLLLSPCLHLSTRSRSKLGNNSASCATRV